MVLDGSYLVLVGLGQLEGERQIHGVEPLGQEKGVGLVVFSFGGVGQLEFT